MQHFQLNLGTVRRSGQVLDNHGRASLTIGDLAHRTGVPISTLRSWERRYGFPEPRRQRGGHRRYSRGRCRGRPGRPGASPRRPVAGRRRPPRRRAPGPVRVRLRRPPAPVPAAPAAGALTRHAGLDEPRDRGRVRGTRGRPGPLRGVPARAVPALVVRPLARARPDGAIRGRARRLPPRGGPRPTDARGPDRGRRPARVAAQPRVAGRVRRGRPARRAWWRSSAPARAPRG